MYRFPPDVSHFNFNPGIIQLLPSFHGLDLENPYLHLREFEEVHKPHGRQQQAQLPLVPTREKIINAAAPPPETEKAKQKEQNRFEEGEEKNGSVKKKEEIKINWLVCFSPFAGDSDSHRR
jgi:hypothetical protein